MDAGRITPLERIQEARARLRDYLAPTPLIESPGLSDAVGRTVRLKLENLQPTGAFKVRPAFNGILARLDEARRRGVVTSSSGNFAQAVAYAGRKLDIRTRIVMMESASRFKRDRTLAYGAEVVLCENTFAARWETTERIRRETGAVLVHPYNSEETIAGDGVIGLELLESLEGAFAVLVPISGGGLVSGIASAVKALRPDCRVIGVQPAANPSMRESVRAGRPTEVEPASSLADALAVARPGERTFAVVEELVDQIALVEEDDIRAAVRRLAVEEKLVVEGGGAVGVAALLAGKVDCGGLDPVCVLSGGNILPGTLAELLAS